jgi:3-phosphoshikimate 1-carboxyvinyltransferase
VTLSAEFVVEGGRPLRGTLRVPGCKGISHRALLLAALADGRSQVSGLAEGGDVASTASALTALGVKIKRGSDGAASIVSGGPDTFREPTSPVDCGNSGTTMRMLAGVLAGCDLHAVLVGDESLSQRPMRRVVEPLRALGAQIDGGANATLAPLSIRGGKLRGAEVQLEVASGQVKTAVLLAGLRADGTTVVSEPFPSRDHTERMLSALGVPLQRLSDRSVSVRRGAPEPFELHVPGDPSSAAFYVVAACLIPGSSIVIEGVSLNPARVEYLDVLREMGASIETHVDGETVGEPYGSITVEAAALHGAEIRSTEAMVDELPALAIAAAFAEGTTTITDAAELRVKESDRIATLQQELAQLGIDVATADDGLVVHGGAPKGAVIKSHGDHRIALAGAVAGLAADGTTTVRGWRAIAVSYPDFERDLAGLLGEA